jgi:hypothetical protein
VKDHKKSTLNKLRKETYPALHNAMYNRLSEERIGIVAGAGILSLASDYFGKALEAGYDAGYKIGYKNASEQMSRIVTGDFRIE